jgi:glycosyltransferase involved in cell wall biosynthesis
VKKKILARFPVLSRSGYGIHSRFVLRSLRHYESMFDIYLQNIPWGACGQITQDDEERTFIDQLLFKTEEYQRSGGQFDISLQVTIPNEFQKLAPANIGISAGIECTTISPAWIEKAMLMDRLIVVSNHAKSGFEATTVQARNSHTGEIIENFHCQTPISVVNYPVRQVAPSDLDLQLKHPFNYLIVAQWGTRKNLENTILWFLEEMQGEEVGLLLKVNIANDSITDSLVAKERLEALIARFPDRKCEVYLLTGDLDESEMAAVYQKASAFISLSHGESWDLPAFEAAYYGVPIITTSYGGHSDFMFMPRKKEGKKRFEFIGAKVDYDVAPVQPAAVWPGVIEKEMMWCYPQKNSYRERVREMYREHKRFKGGAKRLQKFLCENFTKEKLYKQMVEAILGQEIVEVSKDKLPKIGIITSVYKSAEYLEGFFQDVTRQTIFDHCELILINANSPEREQEEVIIKRYMALYPNIRYEVLDADPGLYACWNRAIRSLSPDVTLVTNWNTDDRRASYNLERCASELYLDKDCGGVYYDQYITTTENESWESNTSNGRKYSFPQFSFDALKSICLLHAMPVIRRELFDKYGYFLENYKSASDWEAWLRMASKGVVFKKLDDVLGLYLFSKRGISTDVANFAWKRKEEKEVYEMYKNVQVKKEE